MRISKTLLALTMAAAPMLSVQAVSVIEKQRPHDVELEKLLNRPTAYMGMRVRFDATFVQTAALYDTFHTGFTPGQFMNVIVWDDEANIWDPNVRAAPIMTLYFDKNRDGAHIVSGLDKYALIEIVGEVVSDFRDQAFINIHEILPKRERGRLTDNSVYHVQRGTQLAEAKAYELADEHFAHALEEDIPLKARVSVLRLRAENLINAQSWEEADEVLTEALADSSEPDAYLHYLKARVLGEIAEDMVESEQDADALFAEAVEHASRAVSLDPELGDAYAVLGISLAGLERFDEAKRQCERAIRLLPENAEVRWYLGRILNLQGEYDEAISVLKDAIDRAPKDDRLHKSIAKSYYQRGLLGGPAAGQDIETALREDDIAIRLNPNDADLPFHSGQVLETATERGQEVRIGLKRVKATYDMAIERFEATLAIDEAYTDAHVRLGARYRHKEEHDKAVAHYKRALELEPDRDELYGFLGKYMWDLGKLDEAYEVYLGHHERNPEYIDTLYALGRLSLEVDQDARAIDWLNKVLRLAEDHTMAHADLAESYFEVGNTRDSIEHGNRALELLDDENEKVRVHRFVGLAHWAQDEGAQVIAHLDGRVEGAEDARLPIALGWALSTDAGNAAKVEALGSQATAVDAENAEAAELKGWGQYLGGNFAGAESTLAALYKSDPDNDVLAYRLGMAMFKQGPARYADADPILEQGYGLRSRREMLREARNEIRDARRTIDDHMDQMDRNAREAAKKAAAEKREAERQAAIKAREEAKKKQ